MVQVDSSIKVKGVLDGVEDGIIEVSDKNGVDKIDVIDYISKMIGTEFTLSISNKSEFTGIDND